jgi:tetratricopeptide (TPR) repeat protein
LTTLPDIDGRARTLYTWMQRAAYRDAIDALPAFIEAADNARRPDLCARGYTWLAQAHLHRNQLREARRALRQASAIASALGDTAGLEAISDLRRAVGAKAMQAAPEATTDTTIGRACAALDAGDHEQGAALARVALQEAAENEDPREQVLAWLALARVPSETTAAIHAAAEVADRSNDRNLVTAVAHAARAAGVVFEPRVF